MGRFPTAPSILPIWNGRLTSIPDCRREIEPCPFPIKGAQLRSPAGRFLNRLGSCGGMNRGRGASRRDGPALTALGGQTLDDMRHVKGPTRRELSPVNARSSK
jgi:hypothetical protein